MHKRVFAGLLFLIFLGLSPAGCVKTSEGLEMQSQIDALTKRLDDMEKQNADLKTRFEDSSHAAGDAVLGFTQLQQDLQSLQGKVDNLGHDQLTPQQLTLLRRQLARQFDAIDTRLSTLEKKANVKNPDRGNLGDFTAAGAGAGAAALPGLGPDKPLTEDELYKQAVAAFNQSNFELAKTQFRQYLTTYKQSAKCPEAQYYLATSLFKQNNWGDAILEYDTLINRYPQTSHVAEAYLNSGIAFSQKGDQGSAKLFYDKVVQQFPRSREADIARKKLKAIR